MKIIIFVILITCSLITTSKAAYEGDIVLIGSATANAYPKNTANCYAPFTISENSQFTKAIDNQTQIPCTDMTYLYPSAPKVAVCSFNKSTQQYQWNARYLSNFTYLSQPAYDQLQSAIKSPTEPITEPCEAKPPCDTEDDDTDGVCNACDKKPNSPDPEDCLLGQSTGLDGTVTGVIIDPGCGGMTDEFEYWASETASGSDKWVMNMGTFKDNIGRKTCQTGLPEGQCCAYGPGTTGAQKTVGLSNTGASMTPTVEQMVDSLTALPPPEDLPSNCSGHSNQCQAYCSDKLGVAFSFCREDPLTHKTTSACECNNNFKYEMGVPSEPVPKVDDELKKDSDSDGVPDYADADKLGGADSNSNGIDDRVDSGVTGGLDADGNGVDDTHDSTARAAASASAGLSQRDSENLHDIANNTSGTNDAIRNASNEIRKILEEQGVKDADFQDKMIEAVSSFTTGNEASVEGAGEGTFGAITADMLPVDESETFDVDTYIEGFNYMNEMKAALSNSKVQITSSDSCVGGTIRGAHVSFCFSMFENYFLIMGGILKALAYFRGFDIVVTGGRGFGG